MHGSHSINYHMFYDPEFACYHRDTKKVYNENPCPGPQISSATYEYRGSSGSPFGGYSTPAGYQVSAEPLYGDALVNVCKETRTNLIRLRESLSNADHCQKYGFNHWHFNKEKKEPDVELPEHMRPKWAAPNTFFGSGTDMRKVDWKRPHSGQTDTNDSGPVNKFCYLCTTLDEHQQHIAKRGMQMKEKHKPRARIDFVVPLPYAKAKAGEIQEKKDCLYKVTVKTGNKPNAATSAKVFIQLKGREAKMRPQQLTKKMKNFAFGRNTSETFYIKTPILGELRSMVISHDGLEKKHSWFLDEVEVCDVAARQVYLFTCRSWLSLYEGDQHLKREIRADKLEKFQREYLITVYTGDKALGGTDSLITLTLCGKLGSSSKLRLTRKDKQHATLQKGSKDSFNFAVDDIGTLQKIRIESNNSGTSPDWFLEKIEIEESERSYLFPCGQWIPNDEQQDLTKVSLDLYPATRNSRAFTIEPDVNADKIRYVVLVTTADRWSAGTNANVFLVMFGKKGRVTSEVQLQSPKDNFERGKTDEFKIKAEDVGNLKKIQIRHDNSSLAPGWFLERVVIRRFFPKGEVRDKMISEGMEDDEKALRRASVITGISVSGRELEKKYEEALKKSKKKMMNSYGQDSDSEDDSDNDHKKGSKKTRKKDKDRSGSRGRSSSSGRKGYSDSDSDGKKKKRKKGKKKRKFTYNGIETWVTDSGSESDDDDMKSNKRDSKRRGSKYDLDRKDTKDKKKSKYDTESSSSESSDGLFDKLKDKMKKLTQDSSDDSDAKKKKKRDKKKKSKYDTSSSDDSDDEDKGKKKGKKKAKSKYSKSDSDSDAYDRRKSKKSKKNKKKKSKDSDSDSDSDDKRKSKKSKSKKQLRFKPSSSDSESDSDSDTSGSYIEDGKKRRKKKKEDEVMRRKVHRESSSSEDDTKYSGKLYSRWKKDREPYCDEYEFICRRWLATDEDDRQIQRTLKPSSITTFYRTT